MLLASINLCPDFCISPGLWWSSVLEIFFGFFPFSIVLLSYHLCSVCSSCSVHMLMENHLKWTLSLKCTYPCWKRSHKICGARWGAVTTPSSAVLLSVLWGCFFETLCKEMLRNGDISLHTPPGCLCASWTY